MQLMWAHDARSAAMMDEGIDIDETNATNYIVPRRKARDNNPLTHAVAARDGGLSHGCATKADVFASHKDETWISCVLRFIERLGESLTV
jgi:hypothetical protein